MKSTRIAAAATITALALTACGGEKVGETTTPGSAAAAAPCGTFNLAVNPWVGYEATAAVIAYVAEKDLGCTVTKKDLKEEISWQGFATGEVDAIVENWGHDDLKKKYIDEQKVAVAAGSTGNKGIIGWYVPPWMAEKNPDILDHKNLNKYAAQFKTSESGDKGQLLDGDPSFVTNDEALVKNLKLDYKVVYAGSETALITAFRQAESKKTPLIGYFYEPQWFLAEVPLKKVSLPAYTAGCDADAAKVACDYPEYDLDKIVSKKFADANGPAYNLVKNFNWTNDDQNVVAKYIAQDKMSAADAAKKWVEANPDKVKAWLAG
ncbi:glycine betaine/proline transport system substrate-binding protein [Actinoplanes campanulatus]|uniref:Glycine betaine/proline transport system substrate-binding protein n=1 Tax=Actinoplanes campanulatus TaxID=113559 RepID=A0A7W5FEE1_9ACTN|nr:ABC transporter substrate-binding protein [Actinoplanes campanulatus]MBB3095364.1 glycine betaine/proline transport system substrate-binding protein [Actinoplanes campanulatus]GGN41723.1 glycine/betaine-binding protein [Actinoplanes campanulatus]GID34968.1 glycine/betaine-binding protein [Actinoplanes campanulatus]